MSTNMQVGGEPRRVDHFGGLVLLIALTVTVILSACSSAPGGDSAEPVSSISASSPADTSPESPPDSTSPATDSGAPGNTDVAGGSTVTNGPSASGPTTAATPGSRPGVSLGPTTAPPRPTSGTAPFMTPPPYPGYYAPPPTTMPVPPSPPTTRMVPTSTISFGPVTTFPIPPTTSALSTLVFRCSVSTRVYTEGNVNFAAAAVRSTNRTSAWVVFVWPSQTIERGVNLVNGLGTATVAAPVRSRPIVYVFADDNKLQQDQGCAA